MPDQEKTFRAEDRVFYGKVEGVNDLITFEGSTIDDLEKGFKYMVDSDLANLYDTDTKKL